jgi:hypothetical protein
MKSYPLKVFFDNTTDDRLYLSYGRHDSEQFFAAVREYGATGRLTEPRRGRLRRMRPKGILWFFSFLTTSYGFRPYTLTSEGIPLAGPIEAGEYRLLQDGELVQLDDEFLETDAETWVVMGRESSWIGATFNSGFHMPMRRPVSALADFKQ